MIEHRVRPVIDRRRKVSPMEQLRAQRDREIEAVLADLRPRARLIELWRMLCPPR
jgi:hypothetical protein